MARILVVDDSVENLTLIELFLRGTEFEVETASGGREALELCARERFELILLDVVMPGIDGFEVCRRLKDDPRTAFVPVIFLTGRLVDESDKVAAYNLGAVDYIQKPVNREELVARIRVMRRLEQARSRLDRENVTLRADVETLDRKLQAVTSEIEDLQYLRRAYATSGDAVTVLLDREGLVLAADPGVAAILGPVGNGLPLLQFGHGAARVAALVADGARTADLKLPGGSDGGGQARAVRVVVGKGLEGGAVVILRDVTGLVEAEERVRERELARPKGERAEGEVAHGHAYAMTEFIGQSARVRELAAAVNRLRQNRSTVLIHGESGTGKELVARSLHFDGVNRSSPFIPLHCGAIAPELVESELFGHEKGAFTGAQQSRDGLFRAADGGTIFLDEIAEMSTAVQIKLLRVLQRGEIRPVGANQPRIVNVRVIAATNQDLVRHVQEGKFREDLYYRLQVVRLELPPLRERISDVPLLVDHFIGLGNTRHNRAKEPVQGVSRGAMDRLLSYSWPGNVRELENVIERAFALGVGNVLQLEDLPSNIVEGRPSLITELAPVAETEADSGLPDLRVMKQAAERHAILHALNQSGGDKAVAALTLGMSRSTFYRRLKELGL